MNISTCVIPAAGKGSRWAPISGYLPKEMLPLIDRPVIEWVIQEAIASKFKQVIIIINDQKESIRKYLSQNKHLNQKIKITFLYQKKSDGIASAILLAEKYISEKAFAVALPDLPTISKKPILKQLLENYQQENSHLISLDTFSSENLHLYSECLLEKKGDVFEVIHFCPKNRGSLLSHHKDNKFRMSGRYILSNSIFDILKILKKTQKSSELSDIEMLQFALEKGYLVLGIKIEGHTYDTGTPTSYIRANTAFFKKKHPL